MLALYGHPFSSYTWKALIPLYANETAFEFRDLGSGNPDFGAFVAAEHPAGKFPILVDGETTIVEATAGNTGLALRHMQRACELAPDAVAPRFELACLLAHLGQPDEALAHFRACVAMQPDFAEGWHFIGLTLARQGHLHDALAPLRRAHALDPGNARVLERLAQAEFEVGDAADALPYHKPPLSKTFLKDPAALPRLSRLLDRLQPVARLEGGDRLAQARLGGRGEPALYSRQDSPPRV